MLAKMLFPRVDDEELGERLWDFSISRSLADRYVLILRKLSDNPETLIAYDFSCLKGVVNRCLRNDQWDWFTTYKYQGYGRNRPIAKTSIPRKADPLRPRTVLLRRFGGSSNPRRSRGDLFRKQSWRPTKRWVTDRTIQRRHLTTRDDPTRCRKRERPPRSILEGRSRTVVSRRTSVAKPAKSP